MDVSVVTPSFNMLDYLKRCSASVADQEDATHEHIVMDGGSSDGTAEWLVANPRLIGVVQKDKGMYDAVNKGFRRTRGEIVSHLNCDEQYLPGTLSFVKMYFERHPVVDVLFGDALLVRPNGTLIGFRKGFKPIEPLILSGPLYLFTCAMFIRRKVIDAGELYDDSYKDFGDQEFVARLLRKGYQLRHVRRHLSTFAMTGANRGTYTDTAHEAARIRALSPAWLAPLHRPLRLASWIIKLLTGAYVHDGPVVYSIYPSPDAPRRTTFMVERASSRWRRS